MVIGSVTENYYLIYVEIYEEKNHIYFQMLIKLQKNRHHTLCVSKQTRNTEVVNTQAALLTGDLWQRSKDGCQVSTKDVMILVLLAGQNRWLSPAGFPRSGGA